MLPRARIGCIANVTGEFQPSMTMSAFSATISLARLTPTAGVLSSSLEITVSLRPSRPPLSLISCTMSLTALVTDWPSGPAPPLSGKMVPTLISCAMTGPLRPSNKTTASLIDFFMIAFSLSTICVYYLRPKFTAPLCPRLAEPTKKSNQPCRPEDQYQCQHRTQNDLVPVAAERQQV